MIWSHWTEQNAETLLHELLERAEEKECSGIAALTANKPAAAFVAAVLDLSPYLRAILLRRPQIIEPLFEHALAKRLEALMLEIAATSEGDDVTEAGLMTALRQAKLKGHVLIALGDLSGQFATTETTFWLSRLAEECVGAAVRFLLRDAHEAGKLKLPDPKHPATGTPAGSFSRWENSARSS